VLPEKSCVFYPSWTHPTAAQFYADAVVKKLSLHGQELENRLGKASPVPSQVTLAIQQSNASRNVYLGGLDENTTEEQLRDDLSRFGLIDQVKIVRDKNIVSSISSVSPSRQGCLIYLIDWQILDAHASANLGCHTLPPNRLGWKRVNYGKDDAPIPKSQQAAAQAAQAAAASLSLPNLPSHPSKPREFWVSYDPYLSFTPELGGMGGMNGWVV